MWNEPLVPLHILRFASYDLDKIAMSGIYQDIMFASTSYDIGNQQYGRSLFLKPPVPKIAAGALVFRVPSGKISPLQRFKRNRVRNCDFDRYVRSWRASEVRVNQNFEERRGKRLRRVNYRVARRVPAASRLCPASRRALLRGVSVAPRAVRKYAVPRRDWWVHRNVYPSTGPEGNPSY